MLRVIATTDLIIAILVVVLGASGTYLLLPHRLGSATPRKVHAIGGILAACSLLAFAMLWKAPGGFLTTLFFYAFGFAALAGGLLTVTSRDPIHSALWFASVILSTSGLFLLAGAQFLAAGTVIVYAGAIIVTFLFVIMLAQMEGRAIYDRAARAPGRAAFTCFLLFWGLLYALLSIPAKSGASDEVASESRLIRTDQLVSLNRTAPDRPVREVLAHAARDTNRLANGQGHPKAHVAGLGESLFTDHLIAMELAGTLLFAALVGALAIATPKPPIRPGAHPATPSPHL
jgi:NADH-quinone oxidoreductase subunit J